MDQIRLTIRTVTRDKRAEIGVTLDVTVAEILDAARDNWNLSGDYEYVIRCERLASQLRPSQTLAQAGVRADDVLEIQPLADAGAGRGQP